MNVATCGQHDYFRPRLQPVQSSKTTCEVLYYLFSFILVVQSKNREIAFLAAAEVGDVRTVGFILQTCPDFNVDCVDALGRTALRLAVKNEHTEVNTTLAQLNISRCMI